MSLPTKRSVVAYRVIFTAFIILGVLEIVDNKPEDYKYHRLPRGRIPGICYMISASVGIYYSFKRNPEDEP